VTPPPRVLADTGELGAEWRGEGEEGEEKDRREEEKRSIELARRLQEEDRREEEEARVEEVRERQGRRRGRVATLLGKENKGSCFEAPQPVKRVGQAQKRRRCESEESNNSIDSEIRHFRPIKKAQLTPPKVPPSPPPPFLLPLLPLHPLSSYVASPPPPPP